MGKNRKKRNLWFYILWNIVCILFMFKFFQAYFGITLPFFDQKFDILRMREYIFWLVMIFFIGVGIRNIFRSIRKLFVRQHKDEEEEEEFSEEKKIRTEYTFMEMYRKLSNQRMLVVMFAPAILAITVFLMLLYLTFYVKASRGITFSFSDFFYVKLLKYFFFFTVCFLLFSFKIYRARSRNMRLLFHIYDYATQEELELLNNLGKQRYGYVFTKDYLINWDGTLNIVPLEQIHKIQYKKYFYLVAAGTKLKLKADRNYTIWTCGLSSREWVKRGFLSRDDYQEDNDIHMDIHTPM